ncbi:amidohydrolase [Leekyejoonella antrihumi]|uniref:Amidohydrolase n=1 Tax=Leekyejoonella antrihumi TaxID=1660198 RepID=A0A563E1E6_9MICO|nr:amidohydrolase [Leekyejoonella antrihumi]TWP36031.1 amidohydrolase [Leekyejoonella antrihumi]
MTAEPTLTIYPARLVRTMDPARPTAQAVAVRGDRIRAVGTLEELKAYGPAHIDDRYADAVIFPGFVEAHTHMGSGAMWQWTYVGHSERTDPGGTRWPGCDSIEAVIARLKEADAALDDPTAPLCAWGLDPIFFPGDRLDRRHLDQVSSTRPIGITHQSGHVMTVNSVALKLDGITRDTAVEGVVKDGSGEPTGEMREPAAMALIGSAPSTLDLRAAKRDASGIKLFGADARNHGVTTLVDLGNTQLLEDGYPQWLHGVVDDEDFPARISIFHMGGGFGGAMDVPAAVRRLHELRRGNSDKLRFGNVKFILDGSNQGFTGRLQSPGYLPDDRKGIWVIPPEQFAELFGQYHAAGLTVHAHCNGDEATELFLDTVEDALEAHPRWNHRHTVTHSQLSTAAQYRRMAVLGMCANIFSNHTWHWGDQHHDIILGPDRAARMNAAATALRCGVPITFHCDTPVTPLDALATASHAAARLTPSGRVLGEYERISVPEALHAMTIGAAYTLKMDHEVGSIEAGKYADFAILGQDPFEADAVGLRDVPVHGSVVGGRHFPAGSGD